MTAQMVDPARIFQMARPDSRDDSSEDRREDSPLIHQMRTEVDRYPPIAQPHPHALAFGRLREFEELAHPCYPPRSRERVRRCSKTKDLGQAARIHLLEGQGSHRTS
jgi:hypothetical protein